MSEGHYMRLSIRCPHCGSKTVAEDHKHIDRTADMITFRCKNHLCGHVFNARLEAVRTLEQSRTPSPLVSLPISRNVRRAAHQQGMLMDELTDLDEEAAYEADVYQPIADWPVSSLFVGHMAPAQAVERTRYRYISIRCPHCQANALAIDSREMSPTLREVTYRCRNYRCRHGYVAQLEIVETVSLSSMPARDIRLPLSRHILTSSGMLMQLHELLMAAQPVAETVAQAPPS
ncbi:ogr/Delta-like zinc finger family protein [Comamonadaceae bacterium PP-2]